jgi:hypothetical protein
MKNKHIFWAVLITYLIMSFVPSLGLTSILGKGKSMGKKGK